MKYIDINGNKKHADSGQDKLLKLLYTTRTGRMLLRPLVTPAFSKLAGALLNTSFSFRLIKPFVRSNAIDMSDYEETCYRSYNDFFTRKIKKGAREISGGSPDLISPCDCYASAYEISEDRILTVKNAEYTVSSLLHSKRLAARYQGGYALILRLTVSDYHRYAYAATGRQSKNYRIPGVFHTVNPIAGEHFPIYKENSREYTVIHSSHLGDIVQMEVGALMVGKIVNHRESCFVLRGEEKGYFEFGGSTIVLLLEKDAVTLREDLLVNTLSGYETQLRLGNIIGKSNQWN